MFRRTFLHDLTRNAVLAAGTPTLWRLTWHPRLADDPFALGVASGDPTSTSVVLWTRLAPRPLEPEGGMDGLRTVVTWELAADEQFTQIVKQGRVTAAPELSYSVHVDVTGLEADRWYWYRFQVGQATSPVGRTRTTPRAGALNPMTFAVASCQRYEHGYFTAYEHMAAESLDLVVHLGDYIYEYAGITDKVRTHPGREIRSLDDYRLRYAIYKSDALLQRAHHLAPWVVTWDDHEVDNNYAALVGENGFESDEQMRWRRAAAYQAWWEHMPVRVPRARSWADLTITRSIDWGSLAKFWVLDTRQYRSDQACGDGTKDTPCGDWADPARTLLGAEQERWLFDGLARDSARWQVLANQVMMAPFDVASGATTRWSMDQWGGYPFARQRLMDAIAATARGRTVTITGDIHSSWVNELRQDASRPDSPSVGVEFVGTSIASEGDGSDAWEGVNDATRAQNPQMKWHSARRGYLVCAVTPAEWRTAYRIVPQISTPGMAVQTGSQWRVAHGRPVLDAV
jgi:alkaline phosphatase D